MGQWQERTAPVSGAAGTHHLYLVFKGGAKPPLFDFDYWRFVR